MRNDDFDDEDDEDDESEYDEAYANHVSDILKLTFY